jgi:hypothetical protein
VKKRGGNAGAVFIFISISFTPCSQLIGFVMVEVK